jgi:hypothetical protein
MYKWGRSNAQIYTRKEILSLKLKGFIYRSLVTWYEVLQKQSSDIIFDRQDLYIKVYGLDKKLFKGKRYSLK